ncbi:hypothetical protein [Streptomyces avermitilis]
MGLAALTGPQQALVDFLRVDPHLLRAAGAASASAAVQDDRELARWIAALPAADKDDLLLRLARYGSTGLGSDLLRGYRRSQPPGAAAEPRTAAALIEAADSLRSATAQGGR